MLNNNTGCALCNSTWGDYYETIEDEKLFFCCNDCANIFKAIIQKLKMFYKINSITNLNLQGSSRIRTYIVESDDKSHKGKITFANGKILEIIDQDI